MFDNLLANTRLSFLDGRRRRVPCRDTHGHRSAIIPVPRPEGQGVRIRTEAADYLLTPLEAGHLRDALRQALLDSETTTAASETTGRRS